MMKDLQDTTLAIRLPVYWKKIAQKLSKKHGISMSKFLRHLIEFEWMEHVSERDMEKNRQAYFERTGIKPDEIKLNISNYGRIDTK